MDGITVLMGSRDGWYAETGDPRAFPLVMLHPGGVDARAFGPNVDKLGEYFRLLLPERRAHGHVPDSSGPLSFEEDADDTIAFLEQVVDQPVRLLGCSDGAIVALRVAALRPDLVERLVLVAGVFHYDGWDEGVLQELRQPLPEFMGAMYAEVSPDGIDHYPAVAGKLADLHQVEPTMTVSDLERIRVRTLVMLGDDDEVTLEHATEMLRALPDAELAVVPGTSHGLLAEKPDLCHSILIDFLTRDAVDTFAPRRRSRRSP